MTYNKKLFLLDFLIFYNSKGQIFIQKRIMVKGPLKTHFFYFF